MSRLAALRSIGSSNGSVGCLRQCHGVPRGQLGHGPHGSRSSGARAPQLQTMDHATPRGVAWSLSGILPSALTPESSCVVSFDIQGTSASRRQDRAACRGTQVALFFCVRLLFALRFPRTCRVRCAVGQRPPLSHNQRSRSTRSLRTRRCARNATKSVVTVVVKRCIHISKGDAPEQGIVGPSIT